MSRIVPFQMNTVEGIGAGQKAFVKLTNGPTYQEIILETNLEAADIVKVTLDVGGKHQNGVNVELTGAELLMLQKYHKRHEEAGIFVIPLGDIEGRTDLGQMYGGLVTLPTDNIILRIELAGTLTTVTPTIKGWGYVSAPQQKRDHLPQIKPHTVTNNAVGDFDYTNLPQDANIKRLHCKGGTLSKVVVKKDGADRYEQSAVINSYVLKRNGKDPQADYFHIDHVVRGFLLADMFNPKAVNDLTLRFTTTVGENVGLLVESVKAVPDQVA